MLPRSVDPSASEAGSWIWESAGAERGTTEAPATVARYPSQATLPKEAERIVHAAMPEPVAAVAVAVVNSTLADVANAVPATATAVVRSSVEALVVASRPSSVEDASASDTGSGRRGPVQPHGPL